METWKIGKVTELREEGRKLLIFYPVSSACGKRPKMATLFRSPRDVSVISSVDDLNLNSHEFFETLKLVK